MEIHFVFKAWHFWLLVIIMFLQLVITSRMDDNLKRIADKLTGKEKEKTE